MRFVRYVGKNQCRDIEYQNLIESTQDVMIDWVSLCANSAVTFKLNDKAMAPAFRRSLLDFIDIGMLVYLADEMVSRAKANDFWTRDIRCFVPVAEPEKWRNNELLLSKTLGLLSGDKWSFDWVPLRSLPPAHNHRYGLPTGFDTVCLFSGGTDSLLGAIGLLREGRKVILVGHQSEGQTASAQKELAKNLNRMFPRKICFVQYRVSRSMRKNPEFSLAPKVDRTHRSRSFLFLTLGIGVAQKCGITDVFMPENGLIALNIPLQKSRTGSLSTRTAHPLYISSFLELATKITGFNGNIRNPFLMQSKTDMLHGLDQALNALVLRSISCSRPARYNDRNVRHCGYCVPCIHRRIALMDAGIDSPSDYAFDVFNQLGSMDSNKQQDFRAVVRFATRIATASVTEIQTLVLSQGYFPASVGATIGGSVTEDYAPWTNMIQRWACDMLDKLQSNASPSTRQALGVGLRLRRRTR